MKRLYGVCALVLAVGLVVAQAQWKYEKEIPLPVTDTAFVRPFLCTVDANGRLYLISSKATDTRSHNAIYFADPGATVLAPFIDFDKNGDSDTLLGFIGALRGIGSVGTDIIINASQPYQKTAPNTVSTVYYYTAGDTLSVQKFGFNLSGAGYGTYNHGITLTRDTVAVVGVTHTGSTAGPSLRLYNFQASVTSPALGSWYSATYQVETSTPHSGGVDVIRDCAVLPNGDYTQNTTPLYTSRNSASSALQTGGIAVWTGGSVSAPGSYASQRAADAVGFLNLGTFIPVGITVDNDGYLWVARGDSSGRAVKAFDMTAGIFASEVAELPGQNSPWAPDPLGAPMQGPVDVAVTSDLKKAYVVDYITRSVFEFSNTAVGVASGDPAVPAAFALEQNFPNPFNPTTTISFRLSAPSFVTLTVTNALGQMVATLEEGHLSAGKHVRTFSAGQFPSGVYFYTLTAGTVRQTRSMLLVK
jgi:hypothetical protein